MTVSFTVWILSLCACSVIACVVSTFLDRRGRNQTDTASASVHSERPVITAVPDPAATPYEHLNRALFRAKCFGNDIGGCTVSIPEPMLALTLADLADQGCQVNDGTALIPGVGRVNFDEADPGQIGWFVTRVN